MTTSQLRISFQEHLVSLEATTAPKPSADTTSVLQAVYKTGATVGGLLTSLRVLEDVLEAGLGYARSKSVDTTSVPSIKRETERLLCALIKPYARQWVSLLKKPSDRNFTLIFSRLLMRMLAAFVVGDLGRRVLTKPFVPLASIIVDILPKGLWSRKDVLRDFLKCHMANLVGNEDIWHLQAHFDVWLADRLKDYSDHAHLLREFVSSSAERRRDDSMVWSVRAFNDAFTSYIDSLPDDYKSSHKNVWSQPVLHIGFDAGAESKESESDSEDHGVSSRLVGRKRKGSENESGGSKESDSDSEDSDDPSDEGDRPAGDENFRWSDNSDGASSDGTPAPASTRKVAKGAPEGKASPAKLPAFLLARRAEERRYKADLQVERDRATQAATVAAQMSYGGGCKYAHDDASRKRNLSLAEYKKRKAEEKAASKAASPVRKAARREQINENQQRRQQVAEDRAVRESQRVVRRQVYRALCLRSGEPVDTFSERINSARTESFARYCSALEAVDMASVRSMAAELEQEAGGALSVADAEVFSSPKEYFQFLARRKFCQDANTDRFESSNAALKHADGEYRDAARDVGLAKAETSKRRVEYDTPGGSRALFAATKREDGLRVVRYRRRQEVHRLLRATRAVRVDGVNLTALSASGSVQLDVGDIVLPGEDALAQRSMYTDSASDVEEDHDLGIVRLDHQKSARMREARRRDQARKDAVLDSSLQEPSAGGGAAGAGGAASARLPWAGDGASASEEDVSSSVDFFVPVTPDKGPPFLLGGQFSLSSILVQGGGRLDIRQHLVGQCGRFKGAEVNGERVDVFAEVIAVANSNSSAGGPKIRFRCTFPASMLGKERDLPLQDAVNAVAAAIRSDCVARASVGPGVLPSDGIADEGSPAAPVAASGGQGGAGVGDGGWAVAPPGGGSPIDPWTAPCLGRVEMASKSAAPGGSVSADDGDAVTPKAVTKLYNKTTIGAVELLEKAMRGSPSAPPSFALLTPGAIRALFPLAVDISEDNALTLDSFSACGRACHQVLDNRRLRFSVIHLVAIAFFDLDSFPLEESIARPASTGHSMPVLTRVRRCNSSRKTTVWSMATIVQVLSVWHDVWSALICPSVAARCFKALQSVVEDVLYTTEGVEGEACNFVQEEALSEVMRWICSVVGDNFLAHSRTQDVVNARASLDAGLEISLSSPFLSFAIIHSKWQAHRDTFFRAMNEARVRKAFPSAYPGASASAPPAQRHWSTLPLQSDLKPTEAMKAMASSAGFSGPHAWKLAVAAWDKKPGSTYSQAHPQYRLCAFKHAFPNVSKGCVARTCARCSAKRDFDRKVEIPAGV